jgi:hypothetical protein
VRGSLLGAGGWTRRAFLIWSTVAFAAMAFAPRTRRAASAAGADGPVPLTGRKQAILMALIAQVIPLGPDASSASRVHMQVLTRIRDRVGQSRELLVLYHQGLEQLDAVSLKRYGAGFPELAWNQQFELLSWIDGPDEYYAKGKVVAGQLPALKKWLAAHLPVRTLKNLFLYVVSWFRGVSLQDFWIRLREDVFDAFYSDPVGLGWIGLDAAGMPTSTPGRHFENRGQGGHR